jgi:uncharacterized repeat protein (TIGR03803 family)
MPKPKLWITILLLCVFPLLTAFASPEETFMTLGHIGGDLSNPAGPLVQGFNGNFYGIDRGGAPSPDKGFAFEVGPDGFIFLQGNLHSGTQGFTAGLLQATDGNLYGTTLGGHFPGFCFGVGCGTVFEVTAANELNTVYLFCARGHCPDGSIPVGPLVQAANGNIYGTTQDGGANDEGTVFELSPRGALTAPLYSFCSQPGCTDGSMPSGLIQGTYGRIYGTTTGGGANGLGTFFELTAGGKLTTLYSFCSQPECAGQIGALGLIQANNGNFYGATKNGGANGAGTVFEITPEGELTTLYTFCSQPECADGSQPNGVIQATDGNFYGTTSAGGISPRPDCPHCGTVFELTPEGKLTTLYDFCSQESCTDGVNPVGALVQGTDGSFYGVTGSSPVSDGTVFSLSVGLGPFLETLPTLGKVGTVVIILGNNLTNAISVTFNGTPATFTVVSDTEIEAAVPIGATGCGKVKVTTPSGTLTSDVDFQIT